MDKQTKHILIVGGMGPQASVYAHSLIVKLAARNGAINNEDYPRITHLSVNVKDFISKPTYKQEAADYLTRCIKEIDTSTVDEAFIACNTAHSLIPELQQASGLKFTSLIETAVQAVIKQKIGKVGILATPSTLKTGIYSDDLSKIAEIVALNETSSQNIERIIRNVISGGEKPELIDSLNKEIEQLVKKGAQKVILGCTELSLLGSYLDNNIVIDPLKLTAEKVLTNE